MQAPPETEPSLVEKARKRIADRDKLIVQLNDAAEAIGRVDLEALGWLDRDLQRTLAALDITDLPQAFSWSAKVLHRANERDLKEIRRAEVAADPPRD